MSKLVILFALVALFTIASANPQGVNVVDGQPEPVQVVDGSNGVTVVDGEQQVNVVDGPGGPQPREGGSR
ncbi:hypothetical protein K1T71_010238 [Dendrolimus kikuchii]|uniref:Uncharacterized protein n=1 Tax=Dendrolimus kikuchii TaxID=765133 RepID=A0ACC1CR73_9NEOP|nr:hypothetical protein K1T71_010238 [Dendrolimus kikuchii]